MKTQNSFILQTSEDYDMPYSEVERIYNLTHKLTAHSLRFYELLEEYIKERARNMN